MITKINPTEEQIQIAVMDWARLHPICKHYLIHIPNGGSRHMLEAKKLKRMGVKKGVSDLFLAYPVCKEHYIDAIHYCESYSGLWIELKSIKGKITNEQNEWAMLMEKVGYKFILVKSIEDAILAIKGYLGEL